MYFRTILSGTLAVLLVSTMTAAPGHAGQGASDGGFSFHLPTLGVFGGDKEKEKQTQFAQQSDSAGMTGLEDQIRQMNGKLEELNFQILQMQEQIRKQQEDNEFRFQQLEGSSGGQAPPKKSDAGGTPGRSVAEAPAAAADGSAGQTAEAQPSDENASGQNSTDQIGEVIIDSGNGDPGKVIQGAPPKTFGTITVDKNGNVIDSGQSAPAKAPAASIAPPAKAKAQDKGAVVAALPATDNADELYRNSYQFILSGDYPTAEQGFRDHIARFPKDAKAADAHYWLGEALLGQQKYRDAAEVFLASSKDYPKAKKAPDMLLKLGVSLVGLNQRDVACATFTEVGKRYPEISSALKERVKQEQALASC